MKKAMYIGSFDPFTLGHLSIVKQALKNHDKLLICIGKNEEKCPRFTDEKRKNFILDACASLEGKERIEVIVSSGLAVDIALANNVDVLVRGIRTEYADLHHEKVLAGINNQLAAARGFKLETDFILQYDTSLQKVSSSLVRSLIDIEEYVAMSRYLPPCITEKILQEELEQPFLWLFNDSHEAQQYALNLWQQITTAYSARPYHNLMHLAYMFNMLYHYCNHQETIDLVNTYRSELYLAIFLHDYVYNVQKKGTGNPYENEQQSAYTIKEWHLEEFVRPNINLSVVSALIMATTHSEDHLNGIYALMADLDLCNMGTAEADKWRDDNNAIREEYKIFSDEEYKEGRRNFFVSLLKRKTIFHTKFFVNTLEKQARSNIVNEIERLSSNG